MGFVELLRWSLQSESPLTCSTKIYRGPFNVLVVEGNLESGSLRSWGLRSGRLQSHTTTFDADIYSLTGDVMEGYSSGGYNIVSGNQLWSQACAHSPNHRKQVLNYNLLDI